MADSEWRPFVTTMGVELEYAAFPHEMYWDIMDKALRDHPDPDPPQREIETFDGTELVDDLEDPEYLEALAEARRARNKVLGRAELDLCVRVVGGLERHEDEIRKAAKWLPEDRQPPEDPDERKVWFLEKLAFRTGHDWGLLKRIQLHSQIGDEEVRRKAESFPGDVAGPEGA